MEAQIVANTPQAKALQDAVQKELIRLGMTTEDDTVMSEYCLVMLANNKSPDQVSSELTDLVGADLDSSFIDWLFKQVPLYAQNKPQEQANHGENNEQSTVLNGGNLKRNATAIDGSSHPGPHQKSRRDNNTQSRNQQSNRSRPNNNSLYDRINKHNAPQPFDQRGAYISPQAQAVYQAQARAMAQAFAAMQAAGWQNGSFPQFNGPNMNLQNRRKNLQQQPVQQFPGPNIPMSATAPVFQPAVSAVLPSRPTDEAICKHGVDCTRPPCPYSHPSPVATKESGLVLSSEPCEKQLECQDKDCSKSHVSPAQKNAPAGAAAPIAVPQPAIPNPSSLPGAGEKLCKFGGACTRPGCVFIHPWNTKGESGAVGITPCRFGLGCTRPGCHFSHPPGRRGNPYAAPAKPHFANKSYSATFNSPAAKGNSASGIGSWPTEDPSHVSDRLKRFNPQGETGPVERIIPVTTANAESETKPAEAEKTTE